MKTKYKKLQLLTVVALGVVLSACGSTELDNYPWHEPRSENVGDEDPSKPSGGGSTDPEIMAKEMLAGMAHVLSPDKHKYQYQRANSIDTYAGYWTVTQNKFLYGGALPTTYTFPNDYLMGPRDVVKEVYPAIQNAYFHAERLGVEYRKAIAMIMFDLTIHELSDIYGPVAFDDLRRVKRLPPLTYISQQEVYRRVFEELTEAIAILKRTQPTATDLATIEGPKGGLSRGDWRYWVKLANSIRLRMAMNIVKVDPGWAQLEGERAMNDELGVLTDNDPYDFTQDRNYCDWVTEDNPLFFLSEGWDDIRLGASLENIMKRLKNPLIKVWFTPHGNIVNDAGASTGYLAEDNNYIGVRQGIAMINKSNKLKGYGPYSRAGSGVFAMSMPWMKRTEMLFTMAEAALRGWSVPAAASAEELYLRGIRLSFAENGLGEDEVARYISLRRAEPINYVDPFNTVNSLAGRVEIGVAWDDQDSKEVKLEKIITQKYIAVFPSSLTAWTTFRRTGYPRLFPVYLNNWPGVDSELQLRRIPYVEDVNNQQELSTLPELLGGENGGGTRLWWDVPTDEISAERGDDQAGTPRRIHRNF